MDNYLIKPDVMMITKNVMVPRSLPVPKNKLFLSPSVSNRKTQIIKARKNKVIPKVSSHCVKDIDCSDEQSVCKSEEKLVSNTDYLNYNSNSSIDFEENLKEDYENLINQDFTPGQSHFYDSSDREETNRLHSLSQNFLTYSMPIATSKNVNPSSCGKMLSSKSLKSLISESEDSVEEKLLFQRSNINDNNWIQKNEENEIFNNQISHDSQENIANLYHRVSGETSSEFSRNIDEIHEKLTANSKCEIKYSWQDLENWVPPSQKNKIVAESKESEVSRDEKFDCKVQYSWQVIGTSAQTSDDLIRSLLSDAQFHEDDNESANYPCCVKYSWQIIGTGTQVSFLDNKKDSSEFDEDYWDGKIILASDKKSVKRELNDDVNETSKRAGKNKIMYCEGTQTLADKAHQTELTDCRVKYSWQNLTKRYLEPNK